MNGTPDRRHRGRRLGALAVTVVTAEHALHLLGLCLAFARFIVVPDKIAAEVHDARRKLREAGQETVINVLDAENEVFNAQITATDAEYDARIAVYRLILGLGRLTPVALGIQAGAPDAPVSTE